MNKKPNTIRIVSYHPIDTTEEAAQISNQEIAKEVARSLRVKIRRMQQSEFSHGTELELMGEYVTSRFRSFKYNASFWRRINATVLRRAFRFQAFTWWYRMKPAFQKLFTDQPSKHALIAGHFSFPGGGGTFGDIEAMEVVRDWLDEAGVSYDVAANIEDRVQGLRFLFLNEQAYQTIIFVCGPWYPKNAPNPTLLKRFAHAKRIGVNLTTLSREPSGFHQLLSRDNPDMSRADLAFASPQKKLPVVGILLVDRQKRYGNKQRHQYIRTVVEQYLRNTELAPVRLDTNVHANAMGIWNAQQFESIVSRLDVVITDRLHGLVLSLKNSVPVIAIDPIAGGGKITKQAEALEWPYLIPAEAFSVYTLEQALTSIQSKDAQGIIQNAQERARASNEDTKQRFLRAIQ